MRRQILRFPVGREFKKILEDDHEWYVITDMRLKPLVMERGEEHRVPSHIERKAYETLEEKLRKTNPGKSLSVYGLHTHPAYPSGAVLKVPSIEDMYVFIKDHYHNKKMFVRIKGHGIITKREILIIKLPDTQLKLDELDKTDQTIHDKYLQNYYGYKVIPTFRSKLIGKSDKEHFGKNQYVMADSQERAFKKLAHETPDLKTKLVHKKRRIRRR
jgi:hypothetical protein